MKHFLFGAICIYTFCSCASSKKIATPISYGEIIHEGFINCFANEIVDKKNKPINCEASAVFLANNSLIIAEDKEIMQAGLSPVFSIPLTEKFPYIIPASAVTYLTSESFINVRKIEDMTKEPFGDICFATTDFEWITGKPNEADAYNSILYWKDGDYNSLHYIDEVIDDGIKSSKRLRKLFLNALKTSDYPNGPPYFKIEGICALPDSVILFGIREIGKSFEDPEYTFIVLSSKYHLVNGKVILDNNFKKCYEIDPTKFLGINVGLSGIAYNKFRKEIFFSSSVEEFSNTDSIRLSAYLWSIPIAKFYQNERPELLRNKNGTIIKFNHKIEGITFISKDVMFAVSDQDRLIDSINIEGSPVTRKTFQAIYTLIKVN
ncbi:MAG: hypothetical protein JWP81_3006 [Ferruginibacter sp.]|nr:hypothetical protein [Ferruginibacter sp.]